MTSKPLLDNRLDVPDYWGEQRVVIAFSRQDKGLIGIGLPLKDGGESWTHIRIQYLERMIAEANEYWRKNK